MRWWGVETKDASGGGGGGRIRWMVDSRWWAVEKGRWSVEEVDGVEGAHKMNRAAAEDD